MHGVKKHSILADQLADQRQTLLSFKSQLSEFLANRCTYSSEIFTLTESLLTFNPELYTCWNYRREYISLQDISTYSFSLELLLTQTCISKNPKLYPVWNHRKWIITTMHDPPLERELSLCSKLHSLDDRNFHCWNYRRFITSLCQKASLKCGDLLSEFNYTEHLANINFSNYSTWHQRLVLRSAIETRSDLSSRIKSLVDELIWAKDAVYCEPNDESAWRYLLYLTEYVDLKEISFDECLFSKNFENCIVKVLDNRSILIDFVSPVDPFSVVFDRRKDYQHDMEPAFDHTIMNNENQILIGNICPPLNPGESISINISDQIFKFEANIPPIEYIPRDQLLYISLSIISDVLDLEPSSKWTLLSKAIIIERISNKINTKQFINTTLQEIFSKLIEIDPDRINYYKYKISKNK
ncbi:hypothetical protein RCL1_002866 [Eukaryota sp. TZLM3-RCL]